MFNFFWIGNILLLFFDFRIEGVIDSVRRMKAFFMIIGTQQHTGADEHQHRHDVQAATGAALEHFLTAAAATGGSVPMRSGGGGSSNGLPVPTTAGNQSVSSNSAFLLSANNSSNVPGIPTTALHLHRPAGAVGANGGNTPVPPVLAINGSIVSAGASNGLAVSTGNNVMGPPNFRFVYFAFFN